MEGLTRPMEDRKRQLLFCLACVFAWGLMAHAYGFLHSSFSHDSLLEFNGDGLSNRIRISNGRFISPVCRWIFRTKTNGYFPPRMIKSILKLKMAF